MNFEIGNQGLWIEGYLFGSSPSLAELVTILGVVPESTGPELGLNTVHVFHELGIFVMIDRETERIAECTFAFVPSTVAFSPRQSFAGRLKLNGIWLRAEMRLREVELDGPMAFSKEIGGTWVADGTHYVSISFAKQKLSSVTFCFK